MMSTRGKPGSMTELFDALVNEVKLLGFAESDMKTFPGQRAYTSKYYDFELMVVITATGFILQGVQMVGGNMLNCQTRVWKSTDVYETLEEFSSAFERAERDA